MVKRERVVCDPVKTQFLFRFKDGRVEERTVDSAAWTQATAWPITPERVALWADLIANPTEG